MHEFIKALYHFIFFLYFHSVEGEVGVGFY